MRSKFSFSLLVAALLVSTSSAQTPPFGFPGGNLLYSIPLSVGEPRSVVVNSRNEFAIAIDGKGGNKDYVIFGSASRGNSFAEIPAGQRVLSLVLGDWGAAALTDAEGGLPTRILTAPFGGSFDEIYRGTANGIQSSPSIANDGTVVFASRVTNQHGYRDAFIWRPGSAADLLPELNEESLGQLPYVDDRGRATFGHLFTSPEYRADLYQYDPLNNQWSNLTQSLPAGIAQGAITAANERGDQVFTVGGLFEGYSLMLFRDEDSSLSTIADISKPLPFGFGTRNVKLALAATGELLTVIGGTDFLDPAVDITFRGADGSLIDLESVLPAGQSLPRYPNVVDFALSRGGRILFPAVDDLSGLRSYHHYDYHTGQLRSPPALANVTTPLEHLTLADDGNIYFEVYNEPNYEIRKVTVPEPNPWLLTTISFAFLWLVDRKRGLRVRAVGNC